MTSIFWPKALMQACVHAHDIGLRSQDERYITSYFLWKWGNYPSQIKPDWERVFDQGRDDDGRFAQDIFSMLQRAVAEGQEDDRVFALFLLGTLATPEARNLLTSFLHSEHRKERWASAIALGRLKEERVFSLLQTFLLESFFLDEFSAEIAKIQATEEALRLYKQTPREEWRLYKQTLTEDEYAAITHVYRRVIDYLKDTDYEWYLHQRSECALVLGAWGNPVAVPPLTRALQAAWKMEQTWRYYQGLEEYGPEIWHFFQDCLAFALGQLGAWDALLSLDFPEAHVYVARVYQVLGALQVNDANIFDGPGVNYLFNDSPEYLRTRASMEQAGMGAEPFVEPARAKGLLAEHFGLSAAAQQTYLEQFSHAWHERNKGSRLCPPPPAPDEDGPFLDSFSA